MVVVQLTGLYRGCLCIKEPYYLYIKKAKALQVFKTINSLLYDREKKIGRQSGLLKYEFCSPRQTFGRNWRLGER
jgi:hypothetical protein